MERVFAVRVQYVWANQHCLGLHLIRTSGVYEAERAVYELYGMWGDLVVTQVNVREVTP